MSTKEVITVGYPGLTSDLVDVLLIRMTRNTKVASITLALLELLATLPDEVTYVWHSKWSAMKVLFLLNKYSVLLDMAMDIVVEVGSHNLEDCTLKIRVITNSNAIGTVVSELIPVIRTIAVWGFNKCVMASLISISTLTFGFGLAWIHQYSILPSGSRSPDAILQTLGCVIYLDDGRSWPVYTSLIVIQTGTIALLLCKRRPLVSGSASSNHAVAHTLFYDGTVFFAIIVVISIANLLVMLLARPRLAPLLQMPLRVVHSALCTRVLLNLRRAAAKSTTMSLGTTLHGQHTTIALTPPESTTPLQSGMSADIDYGSELEPEV